MWLTIATAVFLYVAWSIYSLFRNIQVAKQIGLPYVVVPFMEHHLPWFLVSTPLCRVAIEILPESWSRWVKFCKPMWWWTDKYEVYREFDSDIFVIVSPRVVELQIADGTVAADIMNRRVEFPKPIYMYKLLDLLGKNVVTVEGADHRKHRKVTSPTFTDKNNGLVWRESIYQAKSMLTFWTRKANSIVADMKHDSMRITLAIISYAGFGMRMEMESEPAYGGVEHAKALGNGHQMSYQTALKTFLENILLWLIFPLPLLRRSPFKSQRLAARAFDEWVQYSKELYQAKKAAMDSGSASKEVAGESGDLMGALIKASEAESKGSLTFDEIIGNTFVVILAGHETTANTVSWALLLLALNPEYQRHIQAELDKVLGDRPSEEWSYEHDFSNLSEGWISAIFYEALRLYPPVPLIPKWVNQSMQTFTFQGRSFSIPPKTTINIATVPLHRNPNYWVRAGQTEKEAQLDKFWPERWFRDSTEMTSYDEKEALPTDGAFAPEGKDTEKHFYIPQNGFFPFSGGMRACLGRRFAHVEFVAVMALLFKDHTLEQYVEPGESREDARKRADKTLQNPQSIISLAQSGEPVKLRWVPRHRESTA